MKQPIKKNLRSLFVLFATFAMVLSTFGAVFLLNNSPDTYNNEAAYAYTLPAGFTGTVVEIANQLELTGTATVSGIRYKDGKVETEEIGGVDVPLTVSGINVRTAMGQTASPAPYYFVLTADFAATGTWSPITSLAAGNTFDGDGFTISNLTTATANAGLFTTVSGTVKNLTLANVNIGNNGTLANQGAVAGTAAAPAVIENVHVRGGIIKGGDPTGGLVGTINGTGAVKISRCSNTAQVIGAAFVGGIVGQVSSATAVVTVYACKYMGEGRTVAAGSDITSLTGNGCGVGGIVGRMTAGNLSIEYCYFHGGIHTLTAGPTTGKGIGGIFGKLEGGSIKIDGCASEIGTITTANAPTTGAIAPSSVAPGTSTFGTNPANVTNCYYFLNPSMGGGVTPITNILGHTGIGVTNTATDLTYLNLIFDINVKHLGLRIIYVPEPDLPWVNFTFSTGYLYKELKQVPDSSPAVYKTYFKFLDAGALGTEYEEFYKFDFTVTVPATHNIKEPTVTIVRKITNLTLSGEREEQVFPLQNQNANVWDYSIIIDDAEGDEYVAIDIVPVLNTFTVKSISEDSAFDIPEEKEAGFTYLSGFEYINPSSPDMADLVIDGLLINDTFTFTIDVDPGRQRVPPNVRAARFDPITGNPVSPDLILSPVDITGDVYTYELAIKQDSIGYNYEVFIETYETPCFIVLPTEGEWVNYSLDTPTGLDFVEHGGDYMFIVTLDRYYDKGTPKITLSILDGYDYNTGTYVDTGAPGGYTIQEQSRSGGTIVYRIFGVIDDLKIDFLVDELNTYEIDLHSSMEADEYGVVQLKDNDGILTDAFRVYFGGLPYDGSLPYDIGLPYDGAESVNAGTSFTFSIEMEPGWAPKVITLTNAAGKVLYTLTFGEGQVFPDEDEFLTYGRMRGTYVFTINPVASDIYIHVDAYCPVFMISLRALDGVEDVVMGPEFDEEEGGYWSVITDGYVEYRIGPDGEVAFTVYLAEGYKLTEPDVHFWNDERMFAFDDEDNLKEKMEEIGDGVWRYTVRHPDRHIFISITGIPDPSAYTVTFKDIDGDTIGTPQSVPHGTAATPETAPDLSSEGKSF
ncbi:MAG: hypothetical protein FWE84_02370, partial [Firmicutes bacterium]|nr:hypothetical protein [Bacillota bacterium]